MYDWPAVNVRLNPTDLPTWTNPAHVHTSRSNPKAVVSLAFIPAPSRRAMASFIRLPGTQSAAAVPPATRAATHAAVSRVPNMGRSCCARPPGQAGGRLS